MSGEGRFELKGIDSIGDSKKLPDSFEPWPLNNN